MKLHTCTFTISQTEASLAWAKWLNEREWSYYCTLTTRYPMSVKSARRAAKRLFEHLQNNVGGVRLFWVAEPFDTKEGYHIHALIFIGNPIFSGIKELIKKAWQVVSKGKGAKEYNNTVIEPYNKDLGANFYVSKYMMRHNSDYDYLGR